MKKLLIGFVILFLLARLGDAIFSKKGNDKSEKIEERSTSTNDKPYYDCSIHKKFFHNGKCTSCELQQEINKKGGFLDKTKHY